MTLVEFLDLDIQKRYRHIFSGDSFGFKCLRDDAEYKYSLWDCGTFYAEIQCRRKDRMGTRVDGFGLEDDRINLYLDWLIEHKDDEFPD